MSPYLHTLSQYRAYGLIDTNLSEWVLDVVCMVCGWVLDRQGGRNG